MDDQRAQFFILVGDLCVGAGLAGLDVELDTRSGESVRGIPSVPRPGGEEVDDTGYGRRVRLDGLTVDMETVVTARLYVPE